MNLDADRGLIGFVYTVFKTTLLIELIGAALSFIVFITGLFPVQGHRCQSVPFRCLF